MVVILNNLKNPNDLTIEFINETIKYYGITQDPQTKNYMMILNTQLSAHYGANEVLEWIPYDRFNNIEYIEITGVYTANWIDGYIYVWNNKVKNWIRYDEYMAVTLKYLKNPNDFTLEYKNKFAICCGITQDPQTEYYMMVLSDQCKICSYICNSFCFQQNFENWTSGNDDIDKFIQDTQLSSHNNLTEAIEWIPHSRFKNIEYIAKGGFGRVYKANWIDGYIDKWDSDIERHNFDGYINKWDNDIESQSQYWKRRDANMFVALKSLNNSKNITLKYMNEMILHHKVDIDHRIIRFYGITQDPETENYMMVLEYADDGSLRRYLDTDYNTLSWESKIICLYDIITGLKFVHEKNLIHRDLHHGNILKSKNKTAITDMGLCKPTDDIAQKNNRYGVLPYIAPEILREQAYTKASDIYSFGIIMYEIICGLPPFHDVSHDEILAIKICKGLRPRFNIKVPQLIIRLIKSCLDANPLKRPKAEEIRDILYTWRYEPNNKQAIELQAQIKEASTMNNNSSNNKMSSSNLSYETHSEATYTSRLLKFGNLPEPKNSDDYYEQNDNIISVESSGSLQIDIFQLNINDDENSKLYNNG
ncbi:kinase-like domain-containing protein [Rhizophagus clarus]|uniref:Kinase-like domain-containing protein n=1 Tax=Rhizophagus clarus TaxID=94130 RepID=A0A8H3LK77_9GLOM|nr:kinase-like domain-containing protein [Rhizophagus clarus]